MKNRQVLRRANPHRGRFDPERYGLNVCQNCNGVGKWTKEARVIEVCRVCGGFGLVKMEGQMIPVLRSLDTV